MNEFTHLVPPGFRFHPTDEELVDYYLRKKVNSSIIDLDFIKDVDLYRIEPWDLQEICQIGTGEQHEWYLFSHKDKKYPTGTRTNRATVAGFWKATGRDKSIYSKETVVGMRKTLVFYKGRAPNGQKSEWIMHEYRLEVEENGTQQEEGWVVCKVFKKRTSTMRKPGDHEAYLWYDDQVSFVSDFDSSKINSLPDLLHQLPYLPSTYNDDQLDNQLSYQLDRFSQLPLLNASTPFNSPSISSVHHLIHTGNRFGSMDYVTDWDGFEKYVTAEFSEAVGGNACQNLYLNNGSLMKVASQGSKNMEKPSSSGKEKEIY